MAHSGWQMPSPPPAEEIATPSALDATVTTSQQLLRVLQNVGQYVPVPAIGVAASVALSILTIAQTMKDNKEAFLDIGKDACTIMMAVVQRVNLSATGQAPSIDEAVLQRDGLQLMGEMEAIEKCIKKHVKKRGFVKRFVFSQSDQQTVNECRRRLQRALDLFGLQSDMEMRKQLAELRTQMNALLQHLQVQPHGPQMPQAQTPQAQNPPILIPQPQFLQSPHPSNQVIESREDSKAARRAKREARSSQQVIDTSGLNFPSDSTFQNVQNHISPGGNINYSYVAGNVTHSVRDDSFNVAGSNNSINIRFTR